MASYQGMLTLALTVVLLVLPSLTSGETLYVRLTSTNTSCPTYPCHTLSEYAQDIEQYFNESNLTLQFLPGNHSLDMNLTITSSHQLEILGNSSAMVPTMVVCNSNVGLTFRNIQSKMRIDGLVFVSCARFGVGQIGQYHFTAYYGLHLQSVQTAEITDCTFQDSYGSALGVVDSHVILKGNNSFLNNCKWCSNGRCLGLTCYGGGIYAHRSDLSFTGSSSFSGNSAYNGGGVYALTSSNVNISGNTTFSGNSANTGGGVSIWDSSNVNIIGNVTFVNNSAVYGGGVRVQYSSNMETSGNTTFNGNSATYGGGVYARSSSNVNISGKTTFVGNSAISHGGGIYARSSSNVNVSGKTTFVGNSASSNGGGVCVEPNSNVAINGNTDFFYNSARHGGAVQAAFNSSIKICGNTTFYRNSASGYFFSSAFQGGGVNIGFNSNVNISGNTAFIRNLARGHGGGIYAWSNVNVNISGNTTFIGNLAHRLIVSEDRGGGVYIGSNSSTSISGNTMFINNSAHDSGGLYVGFNSKVHITGNTTFIGNSARFSGGGLFTECNCDVDIGGNTSFIDNSARYGGGIFSQSNSSITISWNSTFIDNLASHDGGGVYSRSNNVNRDTASILNQEHPYRTFSTNTNVIYNYDNSPCNNRGVFTSNVSISDYTTFSGNSAKRNGGGIYSESYNNVIISGNTLFSDNSAKRNGGGVYAESNNNITISRNTTFIDNTASGNGGGVCAGSKTIVNIDENANFCGNVASYGGGVYLQFNNSGNISGNTTFIGNSACDGGCGGTYAVTNKIANISKNTTNSITFGGGVYVGSNGTLCINGNTSFISNSASGGDGGGVYAASNSRVYILGNTLFNGNSARNGGCLFVDTFLNLWENCTFTNCLASVGGAIYAKGTQVEFGGTNVFCANKAVHFGGGLYAPKATLNFPGDNTFIANWAGSRGGGIFVQETKMNFSGTGLLSDNEAQLDGGALYADSSSLTLSGNIAIRNNTAQLGGGVYLDNNTFETLDGVNVVERNVATYYGGGIYIRRSPLTLAGKNLFVANSAEEGGGIYAAANSTLNIHGINTFIGNRAHVSGGGIWLDHSNLTLNGSNHFVECVASYEGGAIFTYAVKLSLPGNNTFESNLATTGGGIHIRWSIVSVNNSSNFIYNIAVFGGGIYTDNSTFHFDGSSNFRGNQGNYTGGGIYAARSVLNFRGVSSVTANRAVRDGGGMYTRDDCMVNLLGLSNYQGNSAGDTGGGISAFRSSFNLSGRNTFGSNKAVEGGGVYAVKSIVNSPGESTFVTNSATDHGGGFVAMQSTLHLNGWTSFKNNSAASGGGMYISDSTVDTNGSNCFMNNRANSEGGGIYATDSVVKFNGKIVLVGNTAGSKGAAVHTSFTTLIFQGSSSFLNNSAKYGGGIHSESSNLTFLHQQSNHHAMVSCINCKSICNNPSSFPGHSFFNNTALRGGAQYFDLYSNFSLCQTVQIHFQDNHATEFGGAIYAADVLGPSHLLSWQHIPFRSECFFHIIGKEQSLDHETNPLVFVNNTAGIRGSVLFGGLLEKCDLMSDQNTSALELFKMSIRRKNGSIHPISSDPTQLCFCNKSGLNCREVSQSRSIFPGQQFEVFAIAIDQSGLAIPTLIHTNIRSGHNLTVSETISYETGSNCTSRNYSVIPNNLFNKLELYPSNRSGDTIHLVVNIIFEGCPIGFQESNFTGECICDHRLWQYTNSCDIDRQAILRNASRTFWIGVLYANGTPKGFIHHPYCPFDYCTSERKHINLQSPDQQCDFKRSGLLCGQCKKGLSLLLGNSRCMQCSNNYLALLIPFALAGVLLVILLLSLHLTVAAGTLHGLIFYVNIVAANHHIFFPQSTNNPASIFIAWLNLDLGIQTCFYNGMDAYAKTWLDLVFPVYIWVIVGFLVYVSHRSVIVTKLIGSSPVSVLATLFLLSYAKVLRTIIAALSLTVLHYPHKNVIVWIHDANVSLVKYVPLVLVALLFLLFLFLPYTLLLLLGQWLQAKSPGFILSWMKNPKLKAILDTYHAPYKPKHRYWTGLLLLLRCALFLAFAFNISGDANVNLLVISSAAFGIVVGFALFGSVYKSWYLNTLDLSFNLNLGIFAVATLYVNQSGGSQVAVAYTSVGIAFLTFVGIVIYHIYIQIKSKVQYVQRGHQVRHQTNGCQINDNVENAFHQPKSTPVITRTEVNLHELRSPLDLVPYYQKD